jgi:hypothetical protein
MKLFFLYVAVGFSACAVYDPPIILKKNPDPEAIQKAYHSYLKAHFDRAQDSSSYVSHHSAYNKNPFTGNVQAAKSLSLFEVWKNKIKDAKKQEDYLFIFTEISYCIHSVSSYAIQRSLNSAKKWLAYRNDSSFLDESFDTLSLQDSKTDASSLFQPISGNFFQIPLKKNTDDLDEAQGFNPGSFLTPTSKKPDNFFFKKKSGKEMEDHFNPSSFLTSPSEEQSDESGKKNGASGKRKSSFFLDQMELE